MIPATMDQLSAMRTDIEIELVEARTQVTEAEAAAAAAEAARLTALATRDEIAAAISPLGAAVGAPIALRLADKTRDLAGC